MILDEGTATAGYKRIVRVENQIAVNLGAATVITRRIARAPRGVGAVKLVAEDLSAVLNYIQAINPGLILIRANVYRQSRG